MDTMTLSPPAPETQSRHALIDNVDVRLETVLGQATITVAELNGLKSGAVIPLATSLSDLVEVRLNGVVIAHGELVAVGDQFAVRVVTVAP